LCKAIPRVQWLRLLAAFYRKIPVAHVEADCEQETITHPAEEINRRIISPIASLHLRPPGRRSESDQGECRPYRYPRYRNTELTALLLTKSASTILSANQRHPEILSPPFHAQRIVLVTAHRAENFEVVSRISRKLLKTLSMRKTCHRISRASKSSGAASYRCDAQGK